MNELGNIITGLVIAVVSARVTLHYALKRFYFEKWWERKAEAYTSIFEALHHLKNQVDHELVSERINDPSLRPVVEKVLEELKAKMMAATAEIRKRTDIGAFAISEEAVRALHILLTELDQSTSTKDYPEHLNLRLSAVNKCLDSMRDIAKNDLKVPKAASKCVVREALTMASQLAAPKGTQKKQR
ncbi:MAG: hypothetical protein ACLQJ7_06175 [Syntrophobacteraceae bacterium]